MYHLHLTSMKIRLLLLIMIKISSIALKFWEKFFLKILKNPISIPAIMTETINRMDTHITLWHHGNVTLWLCYCQCNVTYCAFKPFYDVTLWLLCEVAVWPFCEKCNISGVSAAGWVGRFCSNLTRPYRVGSFHSVCRFRILHCVR